MKVYNEDEPIALIHIPKTAGTSVEKIYQKWFGELLFYHYAKGRAGELPSKFDLYSGMNEPLKIYGHFNRAKGFGVKQYYPEICQFITIIRDPFEMAVSGFFYIKKTTPHWREYLSLPTGGVREYIMGIQSGLLNFFPQVVTFDNYKEMLDSSFVEVGVTEYLDESMYRIAKKLNKEYAPSLLHRLNASERVEEVPYGLKENFIERHQLEFALYNYVLSRYV